MGQVHRLLGYTRDSARQEAQAQSFANVTDDILIHHDDRTPDHDHSTTHDHDCATTTNDDRTTTATANDDDGATTDYDDGATTVHEWSHRILL